MKSSKLIYHIYYGTQGTAGLYLDEIYQSLVQKGFEQKVFVSAYYPFNYGEKVYFKHSDIIHGVKNRKLRLAIRYFELIYAMLALFFKTLHDRPAIINFSLLSALYAPEKLYLKAVKLLGLSKIIFTCHDVIPFGKRDDGVMQQRKAIWDMANYYLVHNDYSKHELMDTFGIEEEKILYHSFPVMDLTKMDYVLDSEKKYDFLFQGVLREEKGIDVLLNAWIKFHKIHSKATLLVAGFLNSKNINPDNYTGLNIHFDLKYLDDKEYCQNIASAKCMVLPYKRGTNSGIPSSSISLDCEVISSNIPMFRNNTLILKDNHFISEDIDSLFTKLCLYYENNKCTSVSERLTVYRNKFKNEVSEVYFLLVR